MKKYIRLEFWTSLFDEVLLDFSSNRKYLLVKGKYGFGNRILGLCEAIVYSAITKRKLIIDWRDSRYSDTTANVFPHLFSSPVINSCLKIPETNSVNPAVWKGCLDKDIEYIALNSPDTSEGYSPEQKYSISACNFNYKDRVAVMFDYKFHWGYFKNHLKHLPNHWPTGSVDELLSYLLKNYLTPNRAISKAVNGFKLENFKGPMIGVHIRYTDNVFQKNTNIQSTEDYSEVIENLLQDVPEATIFLSTDNRKIEMEYLKKYKNIVVMEKYFPEKDNQAIHDPKSGEDRLSIAREALTEMYLLSECDYLIYSSKSSFALIAALMSESPSDNIINLCPKKERRKYMQL